MHILANKESNYSSNYSPVTGMKNYKYYTKGQRDTEHKQYINYLCNKIQNALNENKFVILFQTIILKRIL